VSLCEYHYQHRRVQIWAFKNRILVIPQPFQMLCSEGMGKKFGIDEKQSVCLEFLGERDNETKRIRACNGPWSSNDFT
jgi:hypothetical protein